MQGFNMGGKWVPPDLVGVTSGNALQGKHALGARANKISQGILTVRFEMPFPIWCTTCPKPTIIGQGVRFNAEKKKIGNYYSTPIFSFRMKHTACGGWIEIRTDPKNTAYVVAEGARKRDTGEDKLFDGEVKIEILTEEQREERRKDAFKNLEVKIDDRKRLDAAKERIEDLQEVQDQQWEDPYLQNQKLRKAFRIDRKQREHEASVAGALQEKMSLGIELLPESEDDVRRAGFIEFGAVDAGKAMVKTISKPLFAAMDVSANSKTQSGRGSKSSRKLNAVEVANRRKADLAAEIRDNTRAKMHPFLQDHNVARPSPRMPLGIKRKRERIEVEEAETPDMVNSPAVKQAPNKSLVNYGSDSE